MESVVLLNQDFSFIQVINWQRALRLLIKKKVEVIEYTDKVVKNEERTFVITLPRILKLIYYVKNFYKKKVKFNRKNMLLRDNYECAYCGTTGNKNNKLTMDHIIPKSKGGKSTFENTVTCCTSCNSKKKNRTPEESGMVLIKKAYEPTRYDLFKDQISNIIARFL